MRPFFNLNTQTTDCVICEKVSLDVKNLGLWDMAAIRRGKSSCGLQVVMSKGTIVSSVLGATVHTDMVCEQGIKVKEKSAMYLSVYLPIFACYIILFLFSSSSLRLLFHISLLLRVSILVGKGLTRCMESRANTPSSKAGTSSNTLSAVLRPSSSPIIIEKCAIVNTYSLYETSLVHVTEYESVNLS